MWILELDGDVMKAVLRIQVQEPHIGWAGLKVEKPGIQVQFQWL